MSECTHFNTYQWKQKVEEKRLSSNLKKGWPLFKVALVSPAAPRGPVRTKHVTIHSTRSIWFIWYKLKVFRGDNIWAAGLCADWAVSQECDAASQTSCTAINNRYTILHSQWGIQDFRDGGGGANPNLLFWSFSPKTAWNWKKNWTERRGKRF